MTFAIAQYTNLNQEQNSWINGLSIELKSYFKKRNYGKDLNDLYFGLITVRPEFDQFFKKKRPRYRPGIRTSIVDNIEIKTNNCVEIDCKIKFEEVKELKKLDLLRKVSEELLVESKSLNRLSKLQDFDFKKFESDLENYLIGKGYLRN